MKTTVYQIVTDRIMSLLEQGHIPWHKPWAGSDQLPKNLASGKEYRGVNIWLLHAAGYAEPYWLSFKQVKDRGGYVRKGEKANIAVFWKMLDVETEGKDGNKKIKHVPMLRYYNVFNVEQCEGVKYPETVKKHEHEPIKACENVIANMPNRPEIKHYGAKAFYSPAFDRVVLPHNEMFDTAQGYYTTAFHELAHSTGHTGRLDREGITKPHSFGDKSYSKEELCAEMGAAYLCGHCGISPATIENSAAYIQSWLKALKNDNKLVVYAAAQAQKAADYILNKQPA